MSSYSQQSTEAMDSPDMIESNTPRRKFNRRKSFADEAAMTQSYIQTNLDVLKQLWDEVDMSEDNRVTRLHTAYEHIRTLVDDMVEAETKMVESVKIGITDGIKNIKSFREQLQMEEWHSRHSFPSISLLREVEKEEKSLKEVYESRKAGQNEIIERLEVLCMRIGKNILEHLSDSPKILLTRCEFDRIKSTVADLETQLNERVKTALKYQNDLRKWHKCLGKYYGDHDEEALKVFIEEDIENDNFLLNNSIMDRIQKFWQEMDGMYKSWLQDMDMEWTTRYEDLHELWKKCHIGEQERPYGSRFDPDRYNQSDIDAMSSEIMKLQALYNAREPIYKQVSEWKEAWKQKIDMEERKKEASYYKSRDLMRDIQHERHVNEVKLPQLKKHLAVNYAEYKKSHSTDRILIEGCEPIEYIEWIEQEHKLTLERERSDKKAQRNPQHLPPKTPQLKRAGAKTPATGPTIPKQARMTKEPQISIITPTRRPTQGPKTSSPIEPNSHSAPSTPRRIMSPLKKKNY